MSGAEAIRRCAGCLRPSSSSTCSHCGWDDAEHPETQTHLPRHYLLDGHYYLGRVLGQGGFGVTYFAWDLTLDRPVAIKEYLPSGQCSRLANRTTVQPSEGDRREMYAYGLQRFLEEARTLARFSSHPCIVPVSHFIEANGTAYAVMKYLDGVTLKQHLANQGGRIPYPLALEILNRIGDALREVHDQGLLHRDVSPDNIFLTSEGRVMLIDFGAARHALGEHSQSLSVILKPGFAPEEQYRVKGKQGPWTDVYALGATLYRCITGVVPPPAIDRLMQDELEPPSQYCPDLPPSVERALAKALAVRASGRFQTVKEFQESVTAGRAMAASAAPSSASFDPPSQPPPLHPPPRPAMSDQGAPPRREIAQVPPSVRSKAKPSRKWLFVVLGLAVIAAVPAGLFVPKMMLESEARDAIRLYKRGQFAAALPHLQDAARRGNLEAAAYLSTMFVSGRAVSPDFIKAREWALKASAANEPKALNVLGVLYMNGMGVAPDYSLAHTYLRRAADLGDCKALFNLGIFYQSGRGAARDAAQASALFRRAAETCAKDAAQEDTGAMNQMGLMYQTGDGVTKDFAKAADWYGKGAALGDPESMNNLGVLYDGPKPPQDYDQARLWYEKAAAGGNTDAMLNLGLTYEDGSGVTQDYSRARQWYEKAAAGGNTEAMVSIGEMYENEHGVPEDYTQARVWYEKAASAGSSSAMFNLGSLYAFGEGVPKNLTTARQWFAKAGAKFTLEPNNYFTAVYTFPDGATKSVTNKPSDKPLLGELPLRRIRPAEPSPSAPETPSTTLLITCDADCNRFLNDQTRPSAAFPVSPGTYTVKVVLSADQQISTSRQVTVVEGRANEVSLLLLPIQQDLIQAAAELQAHHFANTLRLVDEILRFSPGNPAALAISSEAHRQCDPIRGACGKN
ncbi:MAG TPA: protein kinase [Verrucomicrobiae bacterium]|nr:protein kinase [Verrucomicrobiae bacterium]